MNRFKLSVPLVALLCISACGGGGGDDGAPTAQSGATAGQTGAAPAQGLWSGTTDDNRSLSGIVLSNGDYYVLYSSENNESSIAGVLQGSARADGGSFSSSNGRDFNWEGLGITSLDVVATYVTKQSFKGQIQYGAGRVVNFQTTYEADYERTPTLATIAGNFSGEVVTSVGIQSVSFNISNSGSITGLGTIGCSTSGNVTPRTDGNVYDMTVSFGPAPCLFVNQSLSGVAYYGSGTGRLVAIAPNAARSSGLVFIGSR